MNEAANPAAARRPVRRSAAELVPAGSLFFLSCFFLSERPTDAQWVRFLLGSPPEITHSALAESPTAYRDVLRASAVFLRAVYDAR